MSFTLKVQQTMSPICALAGWYLKRCFFGGIISLRTSLCGCMISVMLCDVVSDNTRSRCITCQSQYTAGALLVNHNTDQVHHLSITTHSRCITCQKTYNKFTDSDATPALNISLTGKLFWSNSGPVHVTKSDRQIATARFLQVGCASCDSGKSLKSKFNKFY